MKTRQVLLCSLVLFTATERTLAQDVVQVLTLSGSNAEFGVSLAALGDLDGDAFPELAIGQAPVFGSGTPSRVVVMRGGDEAPLRIFEAPLNSESYGFAVARIADLDGDGGADLLIGAPGILGDPLANTLVELRSTGSGSLLLAVHGASGSGFGAALVDMGDLNADGFTDFAVGAPFGSASIVQEGRVFVLSGLDGQELYTLDGGVSGAQLGRSLASLPDRNGDGLRELLVGAPGANQVRIYSGGDGAPLKIVLGPYASASFGFSLAAIGDLDGDAVAEFIVGDPRRVGASGHNEGHAWVYSGRDGSVLRGHPGTLAGDFHGYSVAGTVDLDGDGVEDYLIGAPLLSSQSFYPAGVVRAHSGASGSALFSVIGPGLGSAGGFAVADLGDFDGDGFHDIVMSAPLAGKVQVVRSTELLGTPYCMGDGRATMCPCGNINDGSLAGGTAGCTNSSGPAGASLIATGSASTEESDLVLLARGLVPNAPGFYFQGKSMADRGFGTLFGDGLLCVEGSLRRLQLVSADSLGNSRTSTNLVLAGGAQGGQSRCYQLWYRDPGLSPCSMGFNLTNGVRIDWVY